MSASLALEALLEILDQEGIVATRDAAGFNPKQVGILVGLPSRLGSTLGADTYEIPVLVVSGEPLNNADAVDRLYAEADAVAAATSTDRYSVASWDGSSRTDPLPAIEVPVTLTVERT